MPGSILESIGYLPAQLSIDNNHKGDELLCRALCSIANRTVDNNQSALQMGRYTQVTGQSDMRGILFADVPMSGRDAFEQYPESWVASKYVERPLCAQHNPRQNRILARLPPKDYERLLPNLKQVSLPPAWIVHRAGERENHLYFPVSGIVARFYELENGASARLAVTGSEGAIGIASFLSGECVPGQAVVLIPGYAYRLGAEVLKREFARNSPLCRILLRYVMALITQTAQIAVCNRHHTVEQQLCRWLLLSLDRLPGNDVPMTQELISQMLGVRRESVTEAAGRLQHAGLIHCSRGRIAVLDRPQVQAQACECYAVVKREYDRLLPIDDTFDNAAVRAFAAHDRSSISRNQSHRSSIALAKRVPAPGHQAPVRESILR